MIGIIIVTFFGLAISLNILVYKLIVRAALKKHIVPFFKEKGYSIRETKWVGFFKSGDFKQSIEFIPFFFNGAPFSRTYVYVFFEKADNKNIIFKTTAKIKCVLFFIRKVEYAALPS